MNKTLISVPANKFTQIAVDRNSLFLAGIASITIIGACYIITKNNYSIGYNGKKHSFILSPIIDNDNRYCPS